jgi:hypothetical protein
MYEDDGKFTDVNVFSSALSIAQMMQQTTAGGEECGAPGDYLSWSEMEWELHSMARMEAVQVSREGPCRAVSRMQVYPAGNHEDCMRHCQKVGGGRSPPMRTQQEWETMQTELLKVTAPDDMHLMAMLDTSSGAIWMAATDEEEESVWKDYYVDPLSHGGGAQIIFLPHALLLLIRGSHPYVPTHPRQIIRCCYFL